jgi:hypothetical protein
MPFYAVSKPPRVGIVCLVFDLRRNKSWTSRIIDNRILMGQWRKYQHRRFVPVGSESRSDGLMGPHFSVFCRAQ